MNKRRLEDKVAVVTGSGRGIGRSEALYLAREGAKVVVSDFGKDSEGRSLAVLVADEIRAAGGEAVPVAEDLMNSEGARRTVEAARDTFGGLDIIVNNAGLRGGNPVTKLTDEQWDMVLGSHLKASFLMIKHGVPLLRARGAGVIINTGSEAGLGMVFNSAYASAKEGLAGLTRSIAREQGRFNIRCNLIRPRATAGNTGGGDWFATNLAGIWRPFVQSLGRYWIGERGHAGWDRKAPPDSIAAFVTWLCTPAAEHISGQDFFVGGDEIALMSPPRFEATLYHEGGWTVERLDRMAPSITGGLTNGFRVPNPFENDD
ncbi:SDR family NAD(P)-dependent oxidoreductase [Ramlibacter sp.]|uniref:SDR family NAD(P)-dependent oxidoreductase n=1 Tax=Ramlibacter sp. TaxID=1917967 RepID=UPI003D0B636D